MLWYGQNATEKTCVFGVNRPLVFVIEKTTDEQQLRQLGYLLPIVVYSQLQYKPINHMQSDFIVMYQ